MLTNGLAMEHVECLEDGTECGCDPDLVLAACTVNPKITSKEILNPDTGWFGDVDYVYLDAKTQAYCMEFVGVTGIAALQSQDMN